MFICSTALIIFFLATALTEASPFQNGSFEINLTTTVDTVLYEGDSTTIPGWTVTKGNIDLDRDFWVAADGRCSIDMDGWGAHGAIAQTFDTVPGIHYKVKFALSGNSGDSLSYHPEIYPVKHLLVSAAEVSQEYTFDVTGHSWLDPGWVETTFEFTAKNTSTTLTFEAIGPADSCLCVGPAIDNVRLIGASSLPGTLELLLFQ